MLTVFYGKLSYKLTRFKIGHYSSVTRWLDYFSIPIWPYTTFKRNPQNLANPVTLHSSKNWHAASIKLPIEARLM